MFNAATGMVGLPGLAGNEGRQEGGQPRRGAGAFSGKPGFTPGAVRPAIASALQDGGPSGIYADPTPTRAWASMPMAQPDGRTGQPAPTRPLLAITANAPRLTQIMVRVPVWVTAHMATACTPMNPATTLPPGRTTVTVPPPTSAKATVIPAQAGIQIS